MTELPASLPSQVRRPSPILQPTRLGLFFLGSVVLTLIGCINYGLSLGYGLTFLLGGVWLVAGLQAARAVRTLHLTLRPPAQAVAGHAALFTAQVQQEGPASQVMIRAEARQQGGTKKLQVQASLPAGGVCTVPLKVNAPLRGPLSLREVRLIALDDLGLWTASVVVPDMPSVEILVTPAPEADAPAPPTLTSGGVGETGQRVPGQEEFAGVRSYQAGDSPRLISWKHTARTGTLFTREFDAPVGQALDLNWQATAPAGNAEARLSRLAAWVTLAREQGLPFQFSIPGTALKVGSGEAQASSALAALAQFAPLPSAPLKPETKKSAPAVRLPAAPFQFTLLALGVALLPGMFRYPLWAAGLVAFLLTSTALVADPARQQRPLPPLILVLLAVGAGVMLNAQYGTLLGQDAGTAILALLLALKAAETRRVRDARLLALLGLFMTSTHYFHDQGPLTALHSIIAAVFLLAALARWVNPLATDEVSRALDFSGLRLTGRMLLLATPLAALLFMFFPRPDGPLWQLPFQGSNQTGLADEVNAGAFSNLAKNSAVAFRADFAGGLIPPPEQRYWRGPVYEAYDGLSWKQFGPQFAAPSVEILNTGPTYRYSLTLEPNGKPWLLALDTPAVLPPHAILSRAYQAVTFRPASIRTRYEFQSKGAYLGRRESIDRLRFDLLLPGNESPRARALAAPWRELAPPKRVEAALNYLAHGGFSYTLSPPLLPEQNRIDAFLFSSKQGFCEHYASAFAFLMRAAGVPARIVGGYQGGEVNPNGGYLIVRQQDAHAWNEVWLEGQGWVRVDPTAQIAPARINADLGTALSEPAATMARPLTPLARLLLRVDAFQNQWNNLVVGYNGEQQRSILSRLGMGQVGSAPYLLGLAALVGLGLLPILLLVRRAARPRDPAQAALHDLTERLRLPRHPGETASAYAMRVSQLYPQQQGLFSEIAALFNDLRYAQGGAPAEKLRELRRKIGEVRRK